jgi:lysozyme
VNRTRAESFIAAHEGCEFIAYDDTEGKRTVGVGFNLDRAGADTRIHALGLDYTDVYHGRCTLTTAHCSALFTVDLDDAIADAKAIVSNFASQPEDIQMVIVDMIFNLGASGFSKFVNTVAALQRHDYCKAADEMQSSKWAQQVPNRAKDDIALVRLYCLPT